MALGGRNSGYQLQVSNSEPEWSNICNDIFDQYLDGDDMFALYTGQHKESSSGNPIHSFESSGLREQSHETSDTSPLPYRDNVASLSQDKKLPNQPKARLSGEFWSKKLRDLEQNAADVERRQQRLRTAQFHPDFLRIGRIPSPPAMPPSPTDQSCSSRRSRSRAVAVGAKDMSDQRRVTTHRSVSRGRPRGVTKPPVPTCTSPYATVRKNIVSPSKMVTSCGAGAGFGETWTGCLENDPKVCGPELPTHMFSGTTACTATTSQDTVDVFGSSNALPFHGHGSGASPFVSAFHSVTTLRSPDNSSWMSPINQEILQSTTSPVSSSHYCNYQTLPSSDIAPLYSDNEILTDENMESFDFGFSTSLLPENVRVAPACTERTAAAFDEDLAAGADPFAAVDIPTGSGAGEKGPGSSLDSEVNSEHATNEQNRKFSDTSFQQSSGRLFSRLNARTLPRGDVALMPSRSLHGLSDPATPHGRHASRTPSPSEIYGGSRYASLSQRSSRPRKSRSTNPTARFPQSPDKTDFVNFTPQDSGKILSGVAPSGSSKTKARREKEAADKRRKFSQAAVRAVMEAGGDVERLHEAGLMMP